MFQLCNCGSDYISRFIQGQIRPRGPQSGAGVVVVVMPRMLLIWLMTMSLMVLISRSSSSPLFTTNSLLSSLDSADSMESDALDTGLARVALRRRKTINTVLIMFKSFADLDSPC